MIPNTINETIELGDGRQVLIETGKLAKQADGSVVVRLGNTMLLATVVSDKSVGQTDFFPLTVDYREKFSSAGRFPGGFFKREARPSDTEVLTMRLVDRVLRPMFPKDYYSETQVMIQLMSHDDDVMPDALAGLAASACIYISDIPFEDPISEVRLGRINGEYVINPNRKQIEESDIDLMVGASESSVVMVEGEMNEISESEMLDAIKVAHDAIKLQCRAQRNLVEKLGGKTVREYEKPNQDQDAFNKIYEFAYDKCFDIALKNTSKQDRSEQFSALKSDCLTLFDEEFVVENEKLINTYFGDVNKTAVRNVILDKQVRLDGRKPDEVRPIWCEIDYLPSTHGSAIFTRGETQALATVTLGTSREVNVIDSPTDQSEEKFYLHYNFPPFSTGEARPIRGTSRREIGHGNLAQRSLKKMIPEDWAYTIRIVSEILESNGSSSMASVCAGTMALMDTGVPMKRPVSGIAMGLIISDDSYTILSDILGDEDHLGDMDFKIAGTQEGITACQMDIKVKGLSYDILAKAIDQAKAGRSQILEKMLEVIPKPNQEIKAHAPKIIKMTIPKDLIGAFIGPSGKNIQAVQKETNTTIAVIEQEEHGVVEIFGIDQQGIDQAIQAVKNCTFKPEVGTVYDVKVIKILDFGAVVEFVPSKEVLLHISEIDHKRIEKVTDVLSLGDIIQVKYLGIDSRTKKPKVSRKATINKT